MVDTSRKGSTGRFNCDKTYLDAYKIYVKKFNFKSGASELFGGSNPKTLMLNKKEFKEIWFRLSDEIFKEILENSSNLKLPMGLGERFRIQKKKMVYKYIQDGDLKHFDYGTYLKTGSKRMHFNEHSGGYRYKFYWFCARGPVNRKLYKFVPLRIRKRQLADQIKNHNKDYYL